jgi:hypothetical protein
MALYRKSSCIAFLLEAADADHRHADSHIPFGESGEQRKASYSAQGVAFRVLRSADTADAAFT